MYASTVQTSSRASVHLDGAAAAATQCASTSMTATESSVEGTASVLTRSTATRASAPLAGLAEVPTQAVSTLTSAKAWIAAANQHAATS